VTLLLAAASALSFGIADFTGGMATRKNSVFTVVAISSGAALIIAVVAGLMMSGTATGSDLAWGAGSGVAGTTGIGLLYWALARGPVRVVAPVTAVVSAVVPFAVGLALGERPGWVATVGAGIAIASIPLVTAPNERDHRHAARSTVLAAAASGLGFAGFFVLIAQTADTSGMWPLVAAKGAAVAVVIPIALVRGVGADRAGWWEAALAGSIDMAANVFFVLAVRSGLLSLVTVVTSVYPAVTVVLARFVLDERFGNIQRLGMAGSLAGLMLIAAA